MFQPLEGLTKEGLWANLCLVYQSICAIRFKLALIETQGWN